MPLQMGDVVALTREEVRLLLRAVDAVAMSEERGPRMMYRAIVSAGAGSCFMRLQEMVMRWDDEDG